MVFDAVDGKIDHNEFMNGLKRLGAIPPAMNLTQEEQQEIDGWFQDSDLAQDGLVTVEEMKQLLACRESEVMELIGKYRVESVLAESTGDPELDSAISGSIEDNHKIDERPSPTAS